LKINPKQVHKVAVIGLSSPGDMLLASAALWNLRCFLPEANFTLWVGPSAKAVVEGDPIWNEIRPYDRGKEYKGLKGRFKLIQELRKGKFDLIVDLRSTLIPLFSGCKYNPLWGIREVFLPKNIHEAERNLYVVSTLGVPIESRQLHFYVKEEDRQMVEEDLKKVLRGRKLVIFNMGSAFFQKRLPVKLCTEVGRMLIKEQNVLIGVLGYSESEVVAVKKVLRVLGPDVLDLSGPVGFSTVGAYMEKASLFVTGDTAMMHLASAVGTPTVAVFGPSKPQRYGPWGNPHRVVLAPFPCAPCDGKNCIKGKGFRCLDLMEPQKLFDACLKVMKEGIKS
jgi:heptosyltransferase-2